jgi:hypothetical protein
MTFLRPPAFCFQHVRVDVLLHLPEAEAYPFHGGMGCLVCAYGATYSCRRHRHMPFSEPFIDFLQNETLSKLDCERLPRKRHRSPSKESSEEPHFSDTCAICLEVCIIVPADGAFADGCRDSFHILRMLLGRQSMACVHLTATRRYIAGPRRSCSWLSLPTTQDFVDEDEIRVLPCHHGM